MVGAKPRLVVAIVVIFELVIARAAAVGDVTISGMTKVVFTLEGDFFNDN